MRFLVDVRPLRASRDFRRLWAASTLSSISSALTAFAVPLQAYDLTHSTIAVGGIGVAEMAPTLTIGLLGGPTLALGAEVSGMGLFHYGRNGRKGRSKQKRANHAAERSPRS